MRQILLFLCCTLLCSLSESTLAFTPPMYRSLEEHLATATFVFVGVVEEVIPLNPDGYDILDEKAEGFHSRWLFRVRVEEPLTPTDWRPTKPVLAFVGYLISDTKSSRQMIGQRHIFLTRMILLPDWGPVFVPTYGYYLTETVEKKEEIAKLVKPNPTGTQQWSQLNWLAESLKEVETIQPGMSREDVEKILDSAANREAPKVEYISRKCPFVRLEVEFKTTEKNHLDKVKRVSKPFLEWVYQEYLK